MFAMQLSEPGPVTTNRLEQTKVAEKPLTPTQVLIDVEACAMCRTDLQIASGDLQSHKLPLPLGIKSLGGSVRSDRTLIERGSAPASAWRELPTLVDAASFVSTV